MIKSELPVTASCGSADVQNTISCVDCKLSWRLEKELPIQSLTSCFPGPSLLGDIKDADKIKLSVFVLASSNRNPPCIAALHLESLTSPWKIGHLQTWDTDYVADRNTLFNAEYVVCKILNQQEIPSIKREPCQDEKCLVEPSPHAGTKPFMANKQTQTTVRTAMQISTQNNITTPHVKFEPNLNKVTESNTVSQSDVTYEGKITNINISSNEAERFHIDEDLSMEIKDEPVDVINKDELLTLNKPTTLMNQNKDKTTSNVCLKQVKIKPEKPSASLELANEQNKDKATSSDVSLKQVKTNSVQPSTSLTNVSKKDNSINEKINSLPTIKDKTNETVSTHTNVTKSTIKNVNDLNINENKVINIKKEPLDKIEDETRTSSVDNSNISYVVKEEMLEEYLEGQLEGHSDQTTFKIDKNKIFKGKTGNKQENSSTSLRKENDEVPIDVKDEPLAIPDCVSKLTKKSSKDDISLDKKFNENSITKSSQVSLEQECDDNSILMIDTKELKDILKCVQDIGNIVDTEPKTVQNANTNEVIKTVNLEEESKKKDRMQMKNNLPIKDENLKKKAVPKVFSSDDSDAKNSSGKVLTKNTEISGVVANITEKILGDISVIMQKTNLNPTVKEEDVGVSSETHKPTCETSKSIKKELLDKNDHKLVTNEDLTKLVLTRNKNHNDWNVLVTLDNERRKSNNELGQNAQDDLENSEEYISNISSEKNKTLISTKKCSNFENSLGNQNIDLTDKNSGEQKSSVTEDKKSLTKSTKLGTGMGNEGLKNNDGHKLDEKELVNKVKQSIMNEVEYKVQNMLKNVVKDGSKNIITKKTDAIGKDIPKHKKTKNNAQKEKSSTKEKEIKNSKRTKKSTSTKLAKMKQNQNLLNKSTSSSSNSDSSSSIDSSSSDSESCSSSSEYSSSSSSESRSSRSSSTSSTSSRSSSKSSTKSKNTSSRWSQRKLSKLKKTKYKDHCKNKEKDSKKDEDAIIISDDDVKIKVEKITESNNSAHKGIDTIAALNSVNVLVDEKNDGFVCEAQNAPKDINIITRPEYIIITKKSLGNLKVTETEDGKLHVAPQKLLDTKDFSKMLVNSDEMVLESQKEDNILSLTNKRLLNKSRQDGCSTDGNLEEVNKDCSIQDYCNINTSLRDALSPKKLKEVKAKRKKRQDRIKMHRKRKEPLEKAETPNELNLADVHDPEAVEDSDKNPFCKLSVSSISSNRLSDDSHLLLGDSNSDISVIAKKKPKKRSRSKILDDASQRQYERKGWEELHKEETLRKERLNTWISHVNDHLSPDHLRQSRKRKKEYKEQNRHHSKHRKVGSKHKSSHNEQHRKKRKKRKHD